MFEFGGMTIALLIVALLAASLRILREYERGVVFMLGRFWKVKGPGLIIIIPVIQQMVRVDLRTMVFDVPSQDVISRDNVSVKVSNVEIKHVDIDESMVRAIAKQAEAERERRAKVIHAEGELQASEKLLAAAEILAAKPQAMQLRYLQTLTSIAGDRSNTIVFPMPGDLLNVLMRDRKSGE